MASIIHPQETLIGQQHAPSGDSYWPASCTLGRLLLASIMHPRETLIGQHHAPSGDSYWPASCTLGRLLLASIMHPRETLIGQHHAPSGDSYWLASYTFLHTASDQNWRQGRPGNKAIIHIPGVQILLFLGGADGIKYFVSYLFLGDCYSHFN